MTQTTDTLTPVCFYSLALDGRDKPFNLREHLEWLITDVSFDNAPPEIKQEMEMIEAKFGKENIAPLLLGELSEEMGYKPYEQMMAEMTPILGREAMIDELLANPLEVEKKWEMAAAQILHQEA